jgi:hypothetical protein
MITKMIPASFVRLSKYMLIVTIESWQIHDTSVCDKMCRIVCCFYSILPFLLPIQISNCKYNSTALD